MVLYKNAFQTNPERFIFFYKYEDKAVLGESAELL